MNTVPEADRRARVAAFMASVAKARPWAPATAASTGTRGRSTTATKLLIKAATEPGTFLTVMYADLALLPAQGKGAVDELLALAEVKVHRLARQGRGGQPHVLEVLPKGVAELQKLGITPAVKKLTRGGFKHDIYGRWIAAWAKTRGATQVSFEKQLGDKAFDLVIEKER